jgi:hypothetical protein
MGHHWKTHLYGQSHSVSLLNPIFSLCSVRKDGFMTIVCASHRVISESLDWSSWNFVCHSARRLESWWDTKVIIHVGTYSLNWEYYHYLHNTFFPYFCSWIKTKINLRLIWRFSTMPLDSNQIFISLWLTWQNTKRGFVI